jgi:hypothetical protein
MKSMTAHRKSVILFGPVSLLILLFPIHDFLVALGSPNLNGYGGVDYRLYMDTATRWLQGGPYFNPYQLAGSYPISAGDILYPPVALVLFVPFTLLPASLWWAVPAGALGFCLIRLRPGPLAWPFMALCLAWPPTLVKIVTGNPVIWAVAAMALGVLYYWPSVLVLIKPSLFPFALFGANKRRWWLALGGFALVCLPFGALWVDWIRSLINSQGGGLAYSALEIPMLALPIVAWLGRTRRRASELPESYWATSTTWGLSRLRHFGVVRDPRDRARGREPEKDQ